MLSFSFSYLLVVEESANTITSFIIYSPNIILCNFGACSNSRTLKLTALSFDVIQAEKNIYEKNDSSSKSGSLVYILGGNQKISKILLYLLELVNEYVKPNEIRN